MQYALAQENVVTAIAERARGGQVNEECVIGAMLCYTFRIPKKKRGKMKQKWLRLILMPFIVTLIVLSGCSTTAQITSLSRVEYRGHIVGSDQENVYMSLEYINEIARIEKREIAKITHPGLVRGIIWSAVAGYGVLNIIGGVFQIQYQEPYTRTTFAIGVFLPAALGFPLAYEGFSTYSRSQAMLQRPYTPKE